jgi:hypothetical protein
MGYQIDLSAMQRIKVGGVYGLPSGKYVEVLNAVHSGLLVDVVSVRDMRVLDGQRMVLTAEFIDLYGCLCWTAWQWAQRVAGVAAEIEAVRALREKRELAAYQDVDRARVIDAEHEAKKVIEVAQRAANRAVMRLAA